MTLLALVVLFVVAGALVVVFTLASARVSGDAYVDTVVRRRYEEVDDPDLDLLKQRGEAEGRR